MITFIRIDPKQYPNFASFLLNMEAGKAIMSCIPDSKLVLKNLNKDNLKITIEEFTNFVSLFSSNSIITQGELEDRAKREIENDKLLVQNNTIKEINLNLSDRINKLGKDFEFIIPTSASFNQSNIKLEIAQFLINNSSTLKDSAPSDDWPIFSKMLQKEGSILHGIKAYHKWAGSHQYNSVKHLIIEHPILTTISLSVVGGYIAANLIAHGGQDAQAGLIVTGITVLGDLWTLYNGSEYSKALEETKDYYDEITHLFCNNDM